MEKKQFAAKLINLKQSIDGMLAMVEAGVLSQQQTCDGLAVLLAKIIKDLSDESPV